MSAIDTINSLIKDKQDIQRYLKDLDICIRPYRVANSGEIIWLYANFEDYLTLLFKENKELILSKIIEVIDNEIIAQKHVAKKEYDALFEEPQQASHESKQEQASHEN